MHEDDLGVAPSKCLGPDVCKPSDKGQWDGDTCLICEEDHPMPCRMCGHEDCAKKHECRGGEPPCR